MKKLLLSITLLLILGGLAPAQTTESVTVQRGEQRSAAGGKLKVRFIGVTEDSRCPVGATCVWAGNAKVKIELIRRHKAPKVIELNTGLDPRALVVGGYEIKLTAVTPRPGEKPSHPTITINVNSL